MSRLADRPRQRLGVEVISQGSEVALHIPGEPAAFSLNPTAFAIWTLCDGATTIAEMVAAITEVTGQPEPQVSSDVIDAVNQLDQAGLLE